MRHLIFVAFFLAGITAAGQVVGPSINMVTGTNWPDGDPFLQRQNEPSIAVSSRNPLHLLAGANDYRTVDLPGVDGDLPTGDAWLGVFRSVDGGQTWKSTLLPGYPQQNNAASPLRGMTAGADPMVRPGTNGLFYFSGIVFGRGANATSKVFVSRFIDDNSPGGGDTIRYVSTSIVKEGDAGHFQDKPSFAADIPRRGALTCTIAGTPAQSFPGGRVYAAWTEFLGSAKSTDSRILFARSDDCGVTWSAGQQISGQQRSNQAAAIAINPVNGAVYVAWRVFATTEPAQAHAIVTAMSSDGGATFTTPATIARIDPFDQGTTNFSFRTNSYPAIAVDGEGSGTVYVAWSQRGNGPSEDARVMIASAATSPAASWECIFASPLCGANWGAPVAIDNNPDRGHQFMPSLIFSNGKLTAVWYDLRDTNKIATYTATGGGHYTEGVELDGVPIFQRYIEDPLPGHVATARRYTLDVRLAQATTSSGTPVFDPSVRVSRYAFGTRARTPANIRQLELDAPNLPMFQLGTVPFFGDYIDIAGPTFVPRGDGTWRFNTLASDPEHIHVAWTDNRNVVQPIDANWTSYRPVGLDAGLSLYDSTKVRGQCEGGLTGSRNQDIYTARISHGLVVTAKSSSKPLGFSPDNPDQLLQRAFPVTVQNTGMQAKTFRLTIVSQPAGGKATFLQFSEAGGPDPLTELDVTVPPDSSTARTVFMTSPNADDSVQVDVAEISDSPNPLQATIKLNADPSNPPPANRDLATREIFNPDISNPDISNPDISNPDISNPDISNPDISNPDISNPDISNPDISNPALANPDISNPDISNTGIANVRVANPDISNPDISNPDISNVRIANPDISNPDISNPDISNSAITDATWAITNRGNTAASYSLKLLANRAVPQGVLLQLIASKRYNTPTAAGGCTLKITPHYVTLINVASPRFTDAANLASVDLNGPSVSVSPGERILLTIRALDTTTADPLLARVHYNPGTAIVPVPVPDSRNSGAAQPALPLTIVTGNIAAGQIGQPYSQTLEAAGGAGQYRWDTLKGSMLPGLSLDPAGVISGTPSGSGTITLPIQVTDSAGKIAAKLVTLTVQAPATALKITSANMVEAVKGVPYSLTLAASGGSGTVAWTLTSGRLPKGLDLSSGGSIGGVPNPDNAAVFNFTVRATDAAGNSDSRTIAMIVRVQANVPAIASVTSAAPGQDAIAAGSWVTIMGSLLADSTRAWGSGDFAGSQLPLALDGVRVTIDGLPAAVAFVSPTQINVLSPALVKTGTALVQVTNNRGAAVATAKLQTYAPAFFTIGGNYVAAVHDDGTLIAPAGSFGNDVISRPAIPGETVEMFGTGFGPTVPQVSTTSVYQGAATLVDPPPLHITVGGVAANVTFAGTSSNGLNQLNVEIPKLASGNYEVIAEIGGVSTAAGKMITVVSPPKQE